MGVTPTHVARVAVLGLGLIGGSLARALVTGGHEVQGFDTDASTRREAAEAGIHVRPTIDDLCATAADVLVLAVPLATMHTVVAKVARGITTETVLTDVGSVKTPVRKIVVAAGLGSRYVGAHPMSGTEHSGFGASSASLLERARWAVTIAPDTDAQRLLTVLNVITVTLGGTACPLTDAAHDDATALVSHVPHVLANELFNLVAGAPNRRTALGLAAGSFRDGTRVAHTDPKRTEAMVTNNATRVAAALRAIIGDLDAVATALESRTPPAGFFGRAAKLAAADSLDHDTSVGEQLRVRLDEPDWRSTLTTLGELGAYITGSSLTERIVTLSRPASA